MFRLTLTGCVKSLGYVMMKIRDGAGDAEGAHLASRRDRGA